MRPVSVGNVTRSPCVKRESGEVCNQSHAAAKSANWRGRCVNVYDVGGPPGSRTVTNQ